MGDFVSYTKAKRRKDDVASDQAILGMDELVEDEDDIGKGTKSWNTKIASNNTLGFPM